jgi:hypothetical protein
MTTKTHLRQTANGRTACSVSGVRGDGTIIFNSRSTYRNMTSTVVDPDAFRATPAEERCAHCCDRFTSMMNTRRKKAGKPLYADAMTKTFA